MSQNYNLLLTVAANLQLELGADYGMHMTVRNMC